MTNMCSNTIAGGPENQAVNHSDVMLTYAEAARKVGATSATIRNWGNSGLIKVARYSKRFHRVPLGEIIRMQQAVLA